MFGLSLTLLFHLCLIFGIGLRVLFRKLPVSTTLAWIMVVAVFPFVGAVIYFMFGEHKLGRSHRHDSIDIRNRFHEIFGLHNPPIKAPKTSPLLIQLEDLVDDETGYTMSSGGTPTLLTEADAICTSLIKDIERATQNCLLEFYIIEPKGCVEGVLSALESAAQRGVTCLILADSFGSKSFFFSGWPSRLSNAGVTIQKSLSVGPVKAASKRSDLRNHRKIVTIDQTIGYIGSYNLVDPKYFKAKTKAAPWVDIMLRIEGPVVDQLACTINMDFAFDSRDKKRRFGLPKVAATKTTSTNTRPMLFIPSGPDSDRSAIYEAMIATIYAAQTRVIIITPYYVTDEAMQLAITTAARRGLEVTLFVPKTIDSQMSRFASQANFTDLLKSGVKIARFAEGLLHTKAVIIDETLSFVGTLNMDMRSFHLNLEATLLIEDSTFAKEMADLSERYRERSELLVLEDWERRPKPIQLIENIMRLAGPLL
ncbi:cardiolipin synthase [Hellea sp.]|nr:cardiolipin synthase [Hellea sp.]